jgi:zinc and cadmium transporter
MIFLLIMAGSLAGGLGAVLLAAIVLAVKPTSMQRALPRLVSFSTGTLMGAALLGMVPHAAESLPVPAVALMMLIGFMLFFVMEKLLVWRHCHKNDCDVHAGSGPLLLFGDAFHNFVDGVVIAGAFLTSVPLGLTATLSTMTHEVPQEMSEYMVYLHAGYSRRWALFLNSATSLMSVVGGILGYFFLLQMQNVGPYLLAFGAAGFLYVALADLIPAQRSRMSLGLTVLDLLLVVAGIGAISAIPHDHELGASTPRALSSGVRAPSSGNGEAPKSGTTAVVTDR